MKLVCQSHEHLLFAQTRRLRGCATALRRLSQGSHDIFQGSVSAVGISHHVHAVRGTLKFVLQRIDGTVEQPAERIGPMLVDEVAGVKTTGQCQDPQIDLGGDKELQDLVGASLPRIVAI